MISNYPEIQSYIELTVHSAKFESKFKLLKASYNTQELYYK